jgi:hypothetical protein
MSIIRLKAKMSKRKIEEEIESTAKRMSYSPEMDKIIQQPPIVKGEQTQTQSSMLYNGDMSIFLQSKLFQVMFSPTNPGWIEFVSAFNGLFVEELLLHILYFFFASPFLIIHSDLNIYDIFITFNGFILPEPTPDSDSPPRLPPLRMSYTINFDALFSTIGEVGQFRIERYEIRQSDILYFLMRKGFGCLIYVLKHTRVNIDGIVQDLFELCAVSRDSNGNWDPTNMKFKFVVNLQD